MNNVRKLSITKPLPLCRTSRLFEGELSEPSRIYESLIFIIVIFLNIGNAVSLGGNVIKNACKKTSFKHLSCSLV